MPALFTARGFTLLESLVASTLVAGAVVGLAQLALLAVERMRAVRESTAAHVLAQSKLEELRTVPWRYDADGQPVSSGWLAVSPPMSLTEDAAGWFEVLDRFGQSTDADRPPAYRRRWAVSRFSDADPHTLVLRVCVFADTGSVAAIADACVAAIRTRKP